MGNCVACVDKNNKQGKNTNRGESALAGDNRNSAPIRNVKDLSVGKEMFILTNDGKFSEKYSMGNLLG